MLDFVVFPVGGVCVKSCPGDEYFVWSYEVKEWDVKVHCCGGIRNVFLRDCKRNLLTGYGYIGYGSKHNVPEALVFFE